MGRDEDPGAKAIVCIITRRSIFFFVRVVGGNEIEVLGSRSGATILIVPYDAQWVVEFEQESARIGGAMGDVFTRVEHIGSTSVPGLPAKPIIDLMAGARLLEDVIARAGTLAALGYEHVPGAFSGERLFFRRSSGNTRTHHLHVVPSETLADRNEIIFRDYLRSEPEVARDYGRVKQELARCFAESRQAYVEAKTSFIQQVLDIARAQRGLPPVEAWEP